MDDDAPAFTSPSAPGGVPAAEQVLRRGSDRAKTNVSVESAGPGPVDPVNSNKPAQEAARPMPFTDRAQALAETSRLLKENRRLSRRLLSAREEERRRLARTLHNEIGQYLTAMHSEIERISILHAGSQPSVRESVRILAELCGRVQDLTRQILHGLAPPALIYESGLPEALNDLIRLFRQHHGDIRFYLALNRLPKDLDSGIALVAYRVIQEAMTNAVRHAAATRILVGVRGNPPAYTAGLQLVVRDNGCGFDPTSVAYTVGLAGIREAVHACDGKVSIRSRPGSGTRIEATLPAEGNDG